MYVSMLLYTSYPLLPPLHSVPISLFSMSACISIQFSSVQSLSRVRLFAIPWISARQASLSITISWSLLKLRSIESLMPSSHLILCHPLFSSCPQSLPASESFPVSQLFAWGGQSTEVPALATFLPKNTQGWSPLKWTGWISLLLIHVDKGEQIYQREREGIYLKTSFFFRLKIFY